MRSTAQIDAWTATTHRRLRLLQAVMLDLIDCGTTQPTVAPRRPTPAERRAADRSDGEFAPTPTTPASRPVHEADPTLTAVETWETAVEQAVTDLYGTVRETVGIVDSLGLTPLAETGATAAPPAEPATRTTAGGRTIVKVGPSRSRETVRVATAWLAAATDAIADRARSASGDVADSIADRAAWLDRALDVQLARLGIADERTCAEGCGRAAPPGTGATCAACRKRRSRQAAA